MARESQKPPVFSALFRRRYDAATKTFTPETVTSGELQELILALRDEGISLSVRNPANFLKDFLRSANRNSYWPEDIADARYTARQVYSEERVFDFVPYEPEQVVPFPDEFALTEAATIHEIESVSLPSAARALGRENEAWMIQVCVNQRVLETHFALYSPVEAIDLFHLQNSLKGSPEIDAVFLLVFRSDNRVRKALITLEAKRDEPLLPNQIKSQVAVMASQTRKRSDLADIEFILPVAATTHDRDGQRIVAIFEMEMIPVADGAVAFKERNAHDIPLEIAKVVGYIFVPPVAGV
jgi:hypothetical protein